MNSKTEGLSRARAYEQALAFLDGLPRLRTSPFPTPLEELHHLRKRFHRGPRILIKRDDLSTIGFGGNKVRKLEYLFARLLEDGVDTVITTGSETSNHARITAAFCARLQLDCYLVLNAGAAVSSPAGSLPASLYLDRLLGAQIVSVSSRLERAPAMKALASSLRAEGRRVAEIPLGGADAIGSIGYVAAMRELQQQLREIDTELDCIFVASSSGGTQAGIATGCELLGMQRVEIAGVSPDDSSDSINAAVTGLIRGMGDLLAIPVEPICERVTVLDEFVGRGYGYETVESIEALQLLAESEGIFLDPVYTAKAMAALIENIRSGRLNEDDTVLFWHTGGQMALFSVPAATSSQNGHPVVYGK